MRKYFKKTKGVIWVLFILISPCLMNSCEEYIPSENCFTFTGETVTDFLANREDKFGDYISVLKRARYWNFLSTYGNYTCFAPTDSAFAIYLAEREYTSLDQLTQEECDTIARTHIIKSGAYFTTDINEGTLPSLNMLDRFLTLSCDSDIFNNANLIYFINKDAQMIAYDDSVENGVVHTMDRVITSYSLFLPDLMRQDENIKLFMQALDSTHLTDSLYAYRDETYSVSIDSVTEGIQYETGDRVEIGYFPEYRLFKFTAFVEPDSVLKAKAGIQNFDDLVKYAESIYGGGSSDYTDRKNALNKFVSYHLLDRYGSYSSLNCTDDYILDNFDYGDVPDIIQDFFETMMPHTLMKVSTPKGMGVYINRKYKGKKCLWGGVRVYPPSEMKNIEQDALNGIYHYIDNMLIYDENVRTSVLNTRFRVDATTLSQDFMNSGARGWKPATEYISYVYKPGYVKNFEFDENTLLSCRQRYEWFASYYGDNCTVAGQFNLKFKLPPVPEGTYEVRLGYTAMGCRGVVQVYFDEGAGDIPCDIPIDMRTTSYAGWEADTEDDEYNTLIDKAMHNRGYMKGPDLYRHGGGTAFRDLGNIVRRVLVTTRLTADRDYYLRVRQVLDNPKAELSFDYIELCPKDIYGSPEGEDRH